MIRKDAAARSERRRRERSDRVLDAAMRLLVELGGRFDTAAARGALAAGNGMERALVFWASLHGVLQLRKLLRFTSGIAVEDTLAPQALEALLRGWGAGTDHLAEAHALF